MREAQLRHACRFAVLVLLLACAQGTHAQTPARVQWSLRAESPTALRAGTEVPITLVAAIEPGWHIYSLTQKSGGPIPLTISKTMPPWASRSSCIRAPPSSESRSSC